MSGGTVGINVEMHRLPTMDLHRYRMRPDTLPPHGNDATKAGLPDGLHATVSRVGWGGGGRKVILLTEPSHRRNQKGKDGTEKKKDFE